MPTASPLRGRTVVHLTYPDLQARFELITRCLPRLESATPTRRWFFADVPVGSHTGLEVVQLHARTDRSAQAELEAWLEGCRAAGLIATATFADTAMVLDPGLFPDHRVPVFYAPAMADGSARAAVVLERAGWPVSESGVAAEIAALYAELVPRPGARHMALELYATWLEWAAAPTPSPSIRPDRTTVRASLVARLAHTQAVRLRGPDYPGGLIREAEMVRSLLRPVAATTSSARATGT